MLSDMLRQVFYLFFQIDDYIHRVTSSIGTELIKLFEENLHIARALKVLNGIRCGGI